MLIHTYELLWQLVRRCLGVNRFSEDGGSRKPPQGNAVLPSLSAAEGIVIQDCGISSIQTKTSPNTPKEDDTGSHGEFEKPVSTWDFSAASTRSDDVSEKHTQKTDRACKLVHKKGHASGLADTARNWDDALGPPLGCTAEAVEEDTDETNGTIRETKLEYSCVDEVYV